MLPTKMAQPTGCSTGQVNDNHQATSANLSPPKCSLPSSSSSANDHESNLNINNNRNCSSSSTNIKHSTNVGGSTSSSTTNILHNNNNSTGTVSCNGANVNHSTTNKNLNCSCLTCLISTTSATGEATSSTTCSCQQQHCHCDDCNIGNNKITIQTQGVHQPQQQGQEQRSKMFCSKNLTGRPSVSDAHNNKLRNKNQYDCCPATSSGHPTRPPPPPPIPPPPLPPAPPPPDSNVIYHQRSANMKTITTRMLLPPPPPPPPQVAGVRSQRPPAPPVAIPTNFIHPVTPAQIMMIHQQQKGFGTARIVRNSSSGRHQSGKSASCFYKFINYVKKLFRIFRVCRRGNRRRRRRPIVKRSKSFKSIPGEPAGGFFYSNIMLNNGQQKINGKGRVRQSFKHHRRLEQFFEQHRTIMMTLARRKFGVSKMFAEQRKRLALPPEDENQVDHHQQQACCDGPGSSSWIMKPRYRVLNNLYHTLMMSRTTAPTASRNNRMNGYRYAMIRSVSPSERDSPCNCRDCTGRWFNCCAGGGSPCHSPHEQRKPKRTRRKKTSSAINQKSSALNSGVVSSSSSECIDCLISGLIEQRNLRKQQRNTRKKRPPTPSISSSTSPRRCQECCQEDVVAEEMECPEVDICDRRPLLTTMMKQQRDKKMMERKQIPTILNEQDNGEDCETCALVEQKQRKGKQKSKNGPSSKIHRTIHPLPPLPPHPDCYYCCSENAMIDKQPTCCPPDNSNKSCCNGQTNMSGKKYRRRTMASAIAPSNISLTQHVPVVHQMISTTTTANRIDENLMFIRKRIEQKSSFMKNNTNGNKCCKSSSNKKKYCTELIDTQNDMDYQQQQCFCQKCATKLNLTVANI